MAMEEPAKSRIGARRKKADATNEFFWAKTIAYAKTKSWIDGVVWHIGNVDACDVCRSRNGRLFPKNQVPSRPHEGCMCRIDLHIEGDPIDESTNCTRLENRTRSRKRPGVIEIRGHQLFGTIIKGLVLLVFILLAARACHLYV